MLKYLRRHNVDLHKNFHQVCTHTKPWDKNLKGAPAPSQEFWDKVIVSFSLYDQNKILSHFILCPFCTWWTTLWRFSLCTLKHSQEIYLNSCKCIGVYVKQWNSRLKRKMGESLQDKPKCLCETWISNLWLAFTFSSLNWNTTPYTK